MAKVKRGPLSKAEIFYIEGHHEELSAQEIASDLNRAVAVVTKQIKKSQPKPKVPNVGDQFARQDGVTVMTETASQMIDQKRSAKRPSKKDCVAKIKND
jgi:hypothetical protein